MFGDYVLQHVTWTCLGRFVVQHARSFTSLCSHNFLVLRDHGVYMYVVYI